MANIANLADVTYIDHNNHKINISDDIIKFPITLIEIIIMYCPLLVELKRDQLIDKINWYYMIRGLFKICLENLSNLEGIDNFIHLATVKQDHMTSYTSNLAREHRLSCSGSLIKNIYVGLNYYLLWMIDNTVMVSYHDNDRYFSKFILKSVNGLFNVQSIIKNNYYALIKTNNGLWGVGMHYDITDNNICHPIANVPNNISLVCGDTNVIYLLLDDGTVHYRYIEYRSSNWMNVGEFTLLNFKEKCIDIITCNTMTIFKFENGKTLSTEFNHADKIINEMRYFTFYIDNILKFNEHFLLIMKSGFIYLDGKYDKMFLLPAKKMVNIKKIMTYTNGLTHIIFLLMENGDLYYICSPYSKIEKYSLDHIIDMKISKQFDPIIIVRTKTAVHYIEYDKISKLLQVVKICNNFSDKIVNFIGNRMKLVDGTLIMHSGEKLCMDINLMDCYSEHDNGSFIFVRGNEIFYGSNNICMHTINIILEKGKYVQGNKETKSIEPVYI